LSSTYFGGSPNNGYEPSGLCLDPRGNVFVSGSIFGNVTDHPTTSDAFQRSSGGQNEAFFVVLSPDLSKLRYSSHFGGSGHDRIRDLAYSSSGELVFGGDTYSTNLPVADLTFQTNYRGAGDAYIAKFKATKLPTGDVYDDDTVNFLDVLEIAKKWLTFGQFDTDLSGDRYTDFLDYTILANHWHEQYILPGRGRWSNQPL